MNKGQSDDLSFSPLKKKANHYCILLVKKSKTSEVSPIFFLALELLLLTATFLAFLTRWYLSASVLSDPAGPLGVPRRFLHRGQRKRKGYHTGEKLSCASLLIRHWSHMAWPNPCQVTALSAKQ